MSLLDIAQVGHPILRQPSRTLELHEIESPEIQTFIDDLIATMRHANGAGLAAPQVYNPISVCALEVNNNPRYPYKPTLPLTVLINPVLTPLSEETFSNYEGCLSVPNLRGRVMRHTELRVVALNRHGEPLDFEVRGLTAGTYQHEVDHLLGKLFLDRVYDTTTLSTWAEYEAHHQERFRDEAIELVKKWGA